MNCWKQTCGAVACASILLGTPTAGHTQDRLPRGVDVGRRNAQPVVSDSAANGTSTVRPAIELTRESRRLLDRSTGMASELRQQSTSAFQRGLVPLPDYLHQLAVGEYVDVRAADLTAQQRSEVYRQQIALLEDASQRVAYREPGVPGWRSDALLAELAVTEARLKLAEANGDTVAMAALKADSELLAEAHFGQRALDYRTAFATLPMMARSARLSAGTSLARGFGAQTAAALELDRRDFLQSVASQTEEWSSIDAGIGRADKVAAARLDRDVEAMKTTLADGQPLTGETVSRISGEYAQLFEHQQEYYRHGTASLYDLAQTWVSWHDVHRLATLNSEDAIGEAEVARRGDALRDLQSLADNVDDLRGRHAADVTFVRLAGRLDALDALYDEVDPTVEYLP